MEHIPDHPDIQEAERTGYPRRIRIPVADIPEIGKCQFNFGVICSSHKDCDACGWNPEVAANRTEKLKLKLEQKRGKHEK